MLSVCLIKICSPFFALPDLLLSHQSCLFIGIPVIIGRLHLATRNLKTTNHFLISFQDGEDFEEDKTDKLLLL